MSNLYQLVWWTNGDTRKRVEYHRDNEATQRRLDYLRSFYSMTMAPQNLKVWHASEVIV